MMQVHESRFSGVLHTLTASEANNLDADGVPKKLGRLFRRGQASYDKESRTVTMAVSSSTPVPRYFGEEVLSHDKGAIRTDRLKNGVSLLFNHEYDQLLGRSQSFELGDPLHVTAKFGPSDLATEKEREVEAGVLVDVSIGYLVHEWEITEDKNGVRTYLAVDWELLEVSLVTVPADPTVGVGRDAQGAVDVKVRSFRKQTDPEDDPDEDEDDEDDEDDDEDERSLATPAAPESSTNQPTQQRTPPMATAAVVSDPHAQNQERIAGLRQLRTTYGPNFTETQLMDAISGDTTVAAARSVIADSIIAAAQTTNVRSAADTVVGGLSQPEQRLYSRAGSIRASINILRPGTFDDTEAGFAREVSDQIRKEAGERGITGLGDGILTPGVNNTRFAAMEAQKRTIASGGPQGAATNFVDVITPPIELLRTRMYSLALGARMLPGLHGTPQFTRQNAAASSNWLSEGQAVPNSDAGLDFFQMSPHRLSMQNSYFRDFLALSNLAVDEFTSTDRTEVLARSLDYAVPFGSGVAPVPLGFMNRTGIGTTLSGSTRSSAGVFTAGAGGVPPTFVDLNAMEAAISTANGNIGTLAWLTTPKVRAAMRSIPQLPGSAVSGFIMPNSKVGEGGTQEGPLGYNLLASSGLPTNFTVNAVANLHPIIFGVWDQVLIGDWDLNEIIPDSITGAAQALYKITEHGYYDTNVRHLECFNIMFVLPS